jgi:hypothetical protein
MTAVADREGASVEYLTEQEGWELLEKRAWQYLHMSAREFIDRWDSGEIQDPERPEVMRVAMLLPLVR